MYHFTNRKSMNGQKTEKAKKKFQNNIAQFFQQGSVAERSKALV